MHKKLPQKTYEPLAITVTNWAPARIAYEQFIEAHPELGLKYTETAYARFMRLHGPALVAAGVCRKAGLRMPALADMRTFDSVAFELLSRNRLGADEELIAVSHDA